LTALKDAALWNDPEERATAVRDVEHIHRYVTTRQSAEGGWGSFETFYRGPGSFTDYSTFIAMWFLLELRQTKPYELDTRAVDEQIRRGLVWILSRYDRDLRGWREFGSPAGANRDLSILYLLVLTKASRSGFAFVRSHPDFSSALTAWVSSALQDSQSRRVSDSSNLQQPQEVFDSSGKFVRSEDSGATIIWQPWSLLLARLLLFSDMLDEERLAQIRSIEEQLFRRVPETPGVFNRGATFMAAEVLYALGSIEL
jgi:hypothetical protein